MVSAKQVSRWRPACRSQTCWSRGKLFLEMAQYLLNHHRIVDASNHFHRAAAFVAGLDVDAEYSFQALSPGHSYPLFSRPPVVLLIRCLGLVAPTPFGGRHQRTVFAVRGKDTVEACQVDAGPGHQSSQLGDEIQDTLIVKV